MAYPQRLLTDDETIVREFHPHWRVLLAALAWLVVAVAILVAGTTMVDDQPVVRWGAVALAALVVVAFTLPPVVRWRFKLYVLTTERIVVRDGIISRGGVEIPLENINNVLFKQNIVERLLGYGDVLVESAGSRGQSRLTDIPDPEMFQSEIYRVREARSIALKGYGDRPDDGAGTAPRDAVAQLSALADLHERGVVSDAEYEAKKRKLMDQI